ncbi:hypothetical protein AMK59_1165 [Oryctes borbonicus]|uniref:UBA domain-containing protein n=1 Tax=Oryctes borbonicus TaxID=1629725 RepID=A0A0T6B9H2_9SCAR|nr:hypothetical protein AMK59_1165 [Oryctes borbonicus]
MESGDVWNCTASSLQALALSPRNEISNSPSPIISPRNSPRSTRRSTTPTVGVTTGMTPPPIPPRRSSPTLEQAAMPNSTSASSTTTTKPTSSTANGTQTQTSQQQHPKQHNGLNEAQSVTNLSQSVIEVPQMSKSSSMQEMHGDTMNGTSSAENTIELSSPETIYGVVSTNFSTNMTKTQTRHQSCPTSKNKKQISCPVKSSTTPNLNSSEVSEEHVYQNVKMPPKTKERVNPLTATASTVCYENLNMDYIKKLVSEGYSRDAVIKALGITRNNVDMACDILHEFGTKHG